MTSNPIPTDLQAKARETMEAVWIIGNRIIEFETKKPEIEAAIFAALQSVREAAINEVRAECEWLLSNLTEYADFQLRTGAVKLPILLTLDKPHD